MERRTVLTSIGIGLTIATAGCVSRAEQASDPGANTENRYTDTEGTSDADATSAVTSVSDEDAEERTLGDGSLDENGLRTPVQVTLTNEAAETREAQLVVRESEDTLFDESFELEADAAVHVSLTELGEYTVQTTLIDAATGADGDTETTEMLDVGYEQFDCNSTTAAVGIHDDGSLTSSVRSTLMACQGVVTERVASDETASSTVGTEPSATGDEQAPGDETHGFVVHNPTGQTWTARLLVEQSSDPAFDGVYTLEPDATAEVILVESGDYRLETVVIETETAESEEIGPDSFDCNASTTQVELDSAGDLELTTISTQMACGESTE